MVAATNVRKARTKGLICAQLAAVQCSVQDQQGDSAEQSSAVQKGLTLPCASQIAHPHHFSFLRPHPIRPRLHSSHIQLANLRAPGDKGYKIPRGFLFDYITCANYTAEIWGWILFTIGVQAVPAALFALAGGYQMTVWALQKHKRLRKVRGAVGNVLEGWNVLEGSSGKGARQGLMGG